MFVEFRQKLFKMGKFKISVGCRMKGVSAAVFLCIRGILYLYWYMIVAMGWLIYGVCWIYYKLFSSVFKLIKKLFVKNSSINNIQNAQVSGVTSSQSNNISRREEGTVTNGRSGFSKINHPVFAVVVSVIALAFSVNVIITCINRASSDSIETISSTTVSDVTAIATSESKAELPLLAEDEIVNKFINEYNNVSSHQMTGVSKGNIRTKYFANSEGCYIEMLNATDMTAGVFEVTINGKEGEEDKIFKVFQNSAKVLDASLTDEQIDTAINELSKSEFMQTDYVLGKLVIDYYPYNEVSYSCRIGIDATIN